MEALAKVIGRGQQQVVNPQVFYFGNKGGDGGDTMVCAYDIDSIDECEEERSEAYSNRPMLG